MNETKTFTVVFEHAAIYTTSVVANTLEEVQAIMKENFPDAKIIDISEQGVETVEGTNS